jgi:transcriptional regulator with XRE-family HTH domain
MPSEPTPGQKIEHLRLERGFTIDQCCVLTGGEVGKGTWWRNEKDKSTPQPGTRKAIAEVLGVKVSDIWPSFADSRWTATMTATGEQRERDCSLEERVRLGERLHEVLAKLDPDALREDADEDGPYEELWKLARSLMYDPEKAPIVITDGEHVHREFDHLTPITQARIVDAKRRRIHARSSRAKAHVASTATSTSTVPTRRRTRERRDSSRSSRGSPSSDDSSGEPDPALGRDTRRRDG